ncbi:Probable galacturonosyltransferase-like 7 [Linum perenne]
MCLESVFFHFLVSETNLETLVRSTFPKLKFKVYYFDREIMRSLISMSVRQALEQPLNFTLSWCAAYTAANFGNLKPPISVSLKGYLTLIPTSLGPRTSLMFPIAPSTCNTPIS